MSIVLDHGSHLEGRDDGEEIERRVMKGKVVLAEMIAMLANGITVIRQPVRDV